MHDTAMLIGQKFFETYLSGATGLKIVDIGAQDVNGSLRSVAPPGNTYTGVDFAEAKGVDVVLKDPYRFPFEDATFDVAVCSNCLEHSEFFWLTFVEMLRILKPEGLLFITVPANAAVHRYPVDCWRFYPDSGMALRNWARRSGVQAELLECFTGRQMEGLMNDFTAVYVKDQAHAANHPRRIQSAYGHYTWGYVLGASKFTNAEQINEDWAARRLLKQLGPALKPFI
jgi:SAM-dependent methyltransferase